MSLVLKLRMPTCVQPDVVPPPGLMGVHTNKIHYMKKHLLDEIPTKTFAPDFMQPVDTEVLNVPDYYFVINDPMDVGTIIMRVQNRYYQCVDELIADFRLVISNCFKFNLPGEVVYGKGLRLEKFFLKVLSQMPEEDELPSDKDPRAPPSPKLNESSAARHQKCREYLKKLQTSCADGEDGEDGEVRDYFKDKWMALSKKLNKHTFKSVQSFHRAVDDIFLQTRNQVRRIYRNTFNVSLDEVSYQHRIKKLRKLLYKTKRADGSLRMPYNPEVRWEHGLVEGLECLASKLERKIDTCRQIEEQRSTVEEYWRKRRKRRMMECHGPRNGHKLNSSASLSPGIPDASDWDVPLNEEERRAIQQQFMKLPMNTKIDIMNLIARNEDVSTDTSSCDLHWFDFKSFDDQKLHMIKNAMVSHTKINLRNMKPSEKKDLQRCLETRLDSINHMLNGNRRKSAHKVRMRSSAPPIKRSRHAMSVMSGTDLSSQQQRQAKDQDRDEQTSDSDSDSDSSEESGSSDSTDRSDPSIDSS